MYIQSKNVTYLCCGTNDSVPLFLWVSKAVESPSLLSDTLLTSFLTLPWSQTLSLGDDKRNLLDFIQNQRVLNDKSGSIMRAYLLKPSVFRGFALVMLGRNAVSTHHRKAFWSIEFIVNGTYGRRCSIVNNLIKCMLICIIISWKTSDFWTKVQMTWASSSLLVIHLFWKLHRG